MRLVVVDEFPEKRTDPELDIVPPVERMLPVSPAAITLVEVAKVRAAGRAALMMD
jgi:hypothetical protein